MNMNEVWDIHVYLKIYYTFYIINKNGLGWHSYISVFKDNNSIWYSHSTLGILLVCIINFLFLRFCRDNKHRHK